MKDKSLTIALIGGGSGGPVTPLLAVAESLKQSAPTTNFIFFGTNSGPERRLAQNADIRFVPIIAGKLRRYFSLANILTPFLVAIGFFQSLYQLHKYRPHVAFGAGGFVQVPVLWAAWCLRIPVLIHQQDVMPSLANTLCAIIAKKITVTFEHSLRDFGSGHGMYKEQNTPKTVYTGNPMRSSVITGGNREEASKFFELKSDLPVILVMGGGMGSLFINNLVSESLPDLTKFVQIIHISGPGKEQKGISDPGYHQYDLITRMDLAYAAANIVVSRAGLATITELSNLGKPAIIIPILNSHQEDNAELLWYMKAAIVKSQEDLDAKEFVTLIRSLLVNGEQQRELVENIKKIMQHNSAKRVAHELLSIVTL